VFHCRVCSEESSGSSKTNFEARSRIVMALIHRTLKSALSHAADRAMPEYCGWEKSVCVRGEYREYVLGSLILMLESRPIDISDRDIILWSNHSLLISLIPKDHSEKSHEQPKLTEAISVSSRGQGVVMSESLNELVKPVRADELRSRANTAQLDGQLILNRKNY